MREVKRQIRIKLAPPPKKNPSYKSTQSVVKVMQHVHRLSSALILIFFFKVANFESEIIVRKRSQMITMEKFDIGAKKKEKKKFIWFTKIHYILFYLLIQRSISIYARPWYSENPQRYCLHSAYGEPSTPWFSTVFSRFVIKNDNCIFRWIGTWIVRNDWYVIMGYLSFSYWNRNFLHKSRLVHFIVIDYTA